MYKFDNKKHIHLLDDKPLHGVTSVLSIIAKPALIAWSASETVKYLIEHGTPYYGADNDLLDHYIVTGEMLNEAKVAHRKKKEKAGDWGTIVHAAIEEWVKTGQEMKLEDSQKAAFENFKKWATENKVEFLESEKHLYSETMWTGGICDLVIKMDGKKYVADIKTSSAIYNEMFYQMAAYALMLEEHGEKDIEGYLVINLRKDGTMDLKMAVDMDLNKRAFLSALELYKITKSIE